MLQMMKRDYLINQMYFLIIFVAIPFIYSFDFSPLFIYMAIILGCVFNIFYYDDHNHVSRTIVSMPIKRNQIVLARYLFLLMIIVIYLMYLWLIDALVHQPLPIIKNLIPTVNYQPIHSITILLTFLFISIVVSIATPIYYFFQSFIKSLLAQGALLIIGVMGLALFGEYLDLIPEAFIHSILEVIQLQPMFFLIGISFICLFISYKISTLIFSKRDIT